VPTARDRHEVVILSEAKDLLYETGS
jgi:hypothetical protein